MRQYYDHASKEGLRLKRQKDIEMLKKIILIMKKTTRPRGILKRFLKENTDLQVYKRTQSKIYMANINTHYIGILINKYRKGEFDKWLNGS